MQQLEILKNHTHLTAKSRHLTALDGEQIDLLPMGAEEIARCVPVYETIAGWADSTVGVTEYDKLPVNARRYLERIQDVTGVPIAMISTSPDRDHTILMHNPYAAQ